MKKVITILLLTIQFFCYSQQKESTKKFQYAELFTLTTTKGSETTTKYLLWDDSIKDSSVIKNENGQPMEFKNDIIALCYVGKMGWELVQMYKERSVLSSGQENHYILKRIIE